MRIKDLQYTKIPGGFIDPGGIFEMDISKMFLLSVDRQNKQALRLNLKTDQNETTAYIRAKNLKEEEFLDFLQEELSKNFIGKSYDEIINTDVKI